MRIVLTGGTGLIGNAIGQELVRRGHELHVLVRDPATARLRLSYPCQIWDWRNAESVTAKALDGADVLIHLAGESVAAKDWTATRKQELRDSRLRTADVLAHAITSPLKAFITASAIGIYGDRGDEILDEDSSPGHDFLAQLCSDWEGASQAILAERHVQLRFGVVLSPLGGFLKQIVPLFRRFGASRLGSGRQYLSWVHIDDVVRILVQAVENSDWQGPYNVVAPEPVTNWQLTEALRGILQAWPAPPAPKIVLHALYGELSTALLGSQRVRSKRLAEAEFRYPTLSEALRGIYPDIAAGEMFSVFEQWVPAEPKAVWDFFASEAHLDRLLPPWLEFVSVGRGNRGIGVGSFIECRLKPARIPLSWRWCARISQWNPMREFVDEQVQGPFHKWHHRHVLEALGGGTLLRDELRWALPMGGIGRIVALPSVFKNLELVFRDRAGVIDQIFCSR